MHSDLLALLEAVKDLPHDDAPRLILADWMTKYGRNDAERARGDFIRLQCRLAQLSPVEPTRREVEAQEQRLRQDYGASWLEDWQGVTDVPIALPACRPPWTGRLNRHEWIDFDRGLVRLGLCGVRWLEDLPQDHPAWNWICGLNLAGLSNQEVVHLAASPVLGRLNFLGLGPAEVRDAGARALAESPHLRRLTSLVLFDAAIGPDGAGSLAGSPFLTNLDSLSLDGLEDANPNYIGDAGACALAASAHLARLTRLSLTANMVGDQGARGLARSTHLGELTTLNLYFNNVGDEGAQALAASSTLSRLTHLDLRAQRPGHPPWLPDPAAIREETKEILRRRFGKGVLLDAEGGPFR